MKVGRPCQIDRIVAVLQPNEPPAYELQLALRGMLASVIETCLQWVTEPKIERTQLSDLLFKTAVGAIATAFPEEVQRAVGSAAI